MAESGTGGVTQTHAPSKPTAEPKARLYAARVAPYPKAVHGPARNVKWGVLIFCLVVYFVLPWLRWDRGAGRAGQALLLDVADRRFYFFDLELWPQDIYYLTGALILGAVGLFLVTSLAGRVWCGYTCPQTVWTDLYMWVERLIEGDRNARMRRDQGPASLDRTWRKLAKHTVWLFIALVTGGSSILYFTDAPTILREMFAGEAPTAAYFFTGLFTATTYLLAGWAREQVCTYMCPWPRFQAAMLDEHSLVVTYQAWRGEPRGHRRHDEARGDLGHCIDCQACVHACPTGIDIRDGIQLECINCGLCVDACNEMMVKTGQPKWLITWDTLSGQKARAEGRHIPYRLLRPRTLIYAGAMVVALGLMVGTLVTRAHMHVNVLHDRAPLFVRMRDGAIRNAYTLKLSNKTQQPATFELTLNGLNEAAMTIAEQSETRGPKLTLPVVADDIGEFRVLVFGRPGAVASQPLDFVLRNTTSGESETYRSVFMGPGGTGR